MPTRSSGLSGPAPHGQLSSPCKQPAWSASLRCGSGPLSSPAIHLAPPRTLASLSHQMQAVPAAATRAPSPPLAAMGGSCFWGLYPLNIQRSFPLGTSGKFLQLDTYPALGCPPFFQAPFSVHEHSSPPPLAFGGEQPSARLGDKPHSTLLQ